MIWFFAAIMLTASISLRPNAKAGFRQVYISPASCLPIKGLFTMLIVLSHFVGYITPGTWDKPYMTIRSWLGQSVVAMFLFYSGFGVMSSIQRKGAAYLRTMPRKRLVTVIADMTLAVLLYGLLQIAFGKPPLLDRFLLSCIGWMGLGNSCWYIHVILICYLCSWLTGLLCVQLADRLLHRKLPWLSVLLAIGILAGYYVFMLRMGKEDYWYNTLMLYPLGMAFALAKPWLEKHVMKPLLPWCLATAIMIAAVILLHPLRRSSVVIYWLWGAAFTLALLLLSCRIGMKSRVLDFFGRHVFSIYILQRLPMLVMQKWGWIKAQPYLCLLLAFIITCPMAVLFDKVTERMHRMWLRDV